MNFFIDEDDLDSLTDEERAQYRKEQREEEQEREFERKMERAWNCTCGAFSRKSGNQVSDCYCGAD